MNILGGGLATYPATALCLGRHWNIPLVVGFLLVCWVGVWYMHDIRAVEDLRRRREEIRRLLDEMGGC